MEVVILILAAVVQVSTGQQCEAVTVSNDGLICEFPFTHEEETFESCTFHDRGSRKLPGCWTVRGEQITCAVTTVGGTVTEGTPCHRNRYNRDGNHVCYEPNETQLPFHWCYTENKTDTKNWGYCVIPPMDSCGYDLVKTFENRSVSEKIPAGGSFSHTYKLNASDIIVLDFTFETNHTRQKRQASTTYQCVVRESVEVTFTATEWIVYPQQSDNEIRSYSCNRSNICTLSTNGNRTIEDNYLVYEVDGNSAANFSSSIVIEVHHEVILKVICSPHGVTTPNPITPLAPADLDKAIEERFNNLYIIIGSVAGGVILIVIIVAVLIVVLLRRKPSSGEPVKSELNAMDVEPIYEEYCTINDRNVQPMIVRDKLNSESETEVKHRNSDYGYDKITDEKRYHSVYSPDPTSKRVKNPFSNIPPVEPPPLRTTPNTEADSATEINEDKDGLSAVRNSNIVMNDNDVYEKNDETDDKKHNRMSTVVMDENEVYENNEETGNGASAIVMDENDVYESNDNEKENLNKEKIYESQSKINENSVDEEKRTSVIVMDENDVYESNEADDKSSDKDSESKPAPEHNGDPAQTEIDKNMHKINTDKSKESEAEKNNRDSEILMQDNDVYVDTDN